MKCSCFKVMECVSVILHGVFSCGVILMITLGRATVDVTEGLDVAPLLLSAVGLSQLSSSGVSSKTTVPETFHPKRISWHIWPKKTQDAAERLHLSSFTRGLFRAGRSGWPLH